MKSLRDINDRILTEDLNSLSQFLKDGKKILNEFERSRREIGKGLKKDASASTFIPFLKIEGSTLEDSKGIVPARLASIVLILNYLCNRSIH